MEPVAFSTREIADLLLLIGALEVEAGDVGATVHLARADLHEIDATGDLFVHRLRRLECGARLVDVRELHGRTDGEDTGVGLLLPDEHAEQRGLTGAVRTDDP